LLGIGLQGDFLELRLVFRKLLFPGGRCCRGRVGHGLRGAVRGVPLVLKFGKIDHRGFDFVQTEDLRAVRGEADRDFLRAVGAE